jgi:hypothetical protein
VDLKARTRRKQKQRFLGTDEVKKNTLVALLEAKGRSELDQVSSRLGSKQGNAADSEKQVDGKGSECDRSRSLFQGPGLSLNLLVLFRKGILMIGSQTP